MNCRIALLPLLLLFSVANPVSAQILYGSIVGKVTDPSRAAVAGAKVTITNKVTGFSRDAATDSSGTFEFPNIPSGSYEVKINAPGFSSAVRSDVPVTINNVSRIDTALELGS